MHSPDRRDWRSNLGCLDAQERVYKKTDLTGTSFGQTGRRVPEAAPVSAVDGSSTNGSARPLVAHLIEDRSLSREDLEEIARMVRNAK